MSEPNQALDMLQRLKGQVDEAIICIQSGGNLFPLNEYIRASRPMPVKFVIGDFEIRDLSTKSHTDT